MSSFDTLWETPEKCPGCGRQDHPLKDGPSWLMINWVGLLNSFLCIDCRHKWAQWESASYVTDEGREKAKPKLLKNLETLARGKKPKYNVIDYDSNSWEYF